MQPIGTMKRYIFFTNIPTPYRTSFYNELARAGFVFEVYYMRIIEADRHWKIDEREISHLYYIDRGFYKMVGRFHIHINPRLIIKLLRSKADIIVGGNWNDINVWALVVLKRMGILKSQLHFWSEANYLTIGASNDNIFKQVVRRFVYNSSNGAQISSGRMTELTFEKWGMPGRQFVLLPNTIDEEKFRISEDELVSRYESLIPVFLMPVRLSEKIKGIVNFFRSIGEENTRKGLFLIAGDGPDRQSIQDFVHSAGLDENIKLLGHCDGDSIVSLYKRANVLVLPSFSDPSPLSLVEALRMKLPLLVSERCGNHFEAVREGVNGYVFDPFEPGAVRRAFESLMLRINDWSSMGIISGELYDEKFNRRVVIEKFMRALPESSRLHER